MARSGSGRPFDEAFPTTRLPVAFPTLNVLYIVPNFPTPNPSKGLREIWLSPNRAVK